MNLFVSFYLIRTSNKTIFQSTLESMTFLMINLKSNELRYETPLDDLLVVCDSTSHTGLRIAGH